MLINLFSDRERLARSLVRDGHYASEAEVIDEALRLLEQRDSRRADEARLESLLIEGLESGPSTPMTPGDWEDIEREGNA